MSNEISNYYMQSRAPIAENIRIGDNLILDVGCAAGYFGENLKNNHKARLVYGIEGYKTAAIEASKRIDVVECVDINRINIAELDEKWGFKRFDYIVFGDVLEHLLDPWLALNQFVKMLGKDGVVLISIPNIRHWSALFPLLFRGEWSYKDSGILDKTHLRFFTKKSAIQLIMSANLDLISVKSLMGRRSRIISKLSGNTLKDILTSQYLIKAKISE